MILERQKPKHDRSNLGYQSSISKAKVPSYAKITFDYGTRDSSRVEHSIVAFGHRKMTKDGSSKGSFMNQVGIDGLLIPR